MLLKFSIKAAVLAATCISSAASAAAPVSNVPAFKRDIAGFIDRLRASPYAPPGFVVIAFQGDKTVFEKAYGVRNLATGAPMTLDTPVYNASITKSYTGVLAALLDAEGKLPLGTTLKDVWPSITMPAPLDPAKISAGHLLSHSSAMFDGGLQFMSNTTGVAKPSDVPLHLAKYAAPVPAFTYSNLGPYIYSAMANTRTGETWHDAIKRRVLVPLGLKATATRVEDFPASSIAHCHTYHAGQWKAVPLKPTPLLNAAGGMYATARDTGRFMKAIATDGASVRGRIPASVLRRTWQRQAEQNVDFLGLQRDGYGLGWDLGAYDGERYVSRSGGYTGCRSYALWLPGRKFGVAVLTVGDTGGNALNIAILKQAIDLWTADPEATKRGAERVAAYHVAVRDAAAKLQSADPRLLNPPPLDPATARAAPGTYVNARLGRFVITRGPSGLVATAGALVADLVPVSANEFLLRPRGEFEAAKLELVGNAAEGFNAFVWDDDRFDRVG